jgi:inorganic phosphate transporter, PiT family
VKRLSAVRWGVAGNIVRTWMLTLPAAALFGAAVYAVSDQFGTGAIGPVVIPLVPIATATALFARRQRQTMPAPVAP